MPEMGDVLAMTWRAVPSIHAVIVGTPGRPHSVIVTDGNNPILIASGLEPEIADHVCNLHNAGLAR